MIANRVMGSLVYRTRKALRQDGAFLSALEAYRFYPTCFSEEGRFNLWHYPGTHGEISAAFLSIPDGRLKFPALLNFNPIREEVGARNVTCTFNLAFAAPTFSEWCTEEREAQVFEKLLVPVYVEFMFQVARSGYFDTGYGDLPHTRYRIFTTGRENGGIIDSYGDYIDALEVRDLALKFKTCLPARVMERINEENNELIEI